MASCDFSLRLLANGAADCLEVTVVRGRDCGLFFLAWFSLACTYQVFFYIKVP